MPIPQRHGDDFRAQSSVRLAEPSMTEQHVTTHLKQVLALGARVLNRRVVSDKGYIARSL
jgi:hypothetical protein